MGLSSSRKIVRYTLMSRNHAVLDFEYDRSAQRVASFLGFHDPDRAPLPIWNQRIARIRDLDMVSVLNRWWSSRGIPASRVGISRTLRDLDAGSQRELAERALGLSLSDQYWIRPEGFERSWSDVNFFDNPFDDEMGRILAGMQKPSSSANAHNPSSTTDGNLPKMWMIGNDGRRYLLKAGSGLLRQEPYNEAAACVLYEHALSPDDYVWYDTLVAGGITFSRCACMVDSKHSFVRASDIFLSHPENTGSMSRSGYEVACDALGIPGAPGMIDRMLALDFVMGNTDRHGGNFGAILNSETGRFVRCAPLFDAGLSLLCSEGDGDIDIERVNANPFAPLQHYQLALVRDLSWFNADVLRDVADEMCAILAQSKNRYLDARRLSFIRAYIESGIGTVAALTEQDPCKTPAEASRRAEMIRAERTRQMKALGHRRIFFVEGTATANAWREAE